MIVCTAVEIDEALENVELSLLYVDEEIVYTMEHEFEELTEDTDKDTACARFERMFEARPSLLRTDSGRGESVYNGCTSYISDRDGKIGLEKYKYCYAYTL